MNRRQTPRRALRPARGISIIELIIAMAILLSITVGTIPLFHRSVVANMTSQGTTELINFAQTGLEDVANQDFNGAVMTLDPGDASEKVVREYYDPVSKMWLAGDPPNHEMARTLKIRQFGISAIDDGIVDQNDALDQAANPLAVHIKQVVVELEGRKKALGLAHQTHELNLMKAN